MGSIYELVEYHAVNNPNKKAIITDDGSSYSYKELLNKILEILENLSPHIINKKSRVMLCVESNINLPAVVLALNAKDVTVIPISTTLKASQIEKFISATDPNIIVVDDKTHNLFIDTDLPKFNLTNCRWVNSNFFFEKEYVGFLITLSSGSTGDPKPIIFTEKNKINRVQQAIELFSLSSDDVILCASPFYHSLGQRLTFIPLCMGATLVILNRFNAESWVRAVEVYGVTFTIPVSSHLYELTEILLQNPQRLKSLKALVSSSAAILPTVKERLVKNLNFEFYEMYGASEIGTATTINLKRESNKILSVGSPCKNVDIKIFNKLMVECKTYEVGQISVKTNLVSPGYYNIPEVTDKSFHKEYFLTGDMGYIDDEGYLYFIDRIKDIIISGGVNIYPSDIEAVIKKISFVKAVTVVGVNDKYLGEVVVAVLILNNSSSENHLEIIKNIVKKELSSWQQPMKYIFKKDLPLTGSGKYDKKKIRDELNLMKLDLTSKLRALKSNHEYSSKS